MSEIKPSSNRSFGVVFFIVFLLISIYPITNNEDLRIWALITSFIFLILGTAPASVAQSSVAQLIERRFCRPKDLGSNPITGKRPASHCV